VGARCWGFGVEMGEEEYVQEVKYGKRLDSKAGQ
jgi:hypothetical protein